MKRAARVIQTKVSALRKPATKLNLRLELDQRRVIGSQMSNLCFNLSQDAKIEERHRNTMRELYKQWDAIKRAESS
jgi:hypothetical protein